LKSAEDIINFNSYLEAYYRNTILNERWDEKFKPNVQQDEEDFGFRYA